MIMSKTDAVSTTKLYFGPWYRKSPFFEATQRAGCKAYDIYNHMYLPAEFGDPVEEYWHLVNHVTVWDVAVERVVEITGPDASEFTNSLTPRDLTKCAVGQGKYVLITAEDGSIINDPVEGLWLEGLYLHANSVGICNFGRHVRPAMSSRTAHGTSSKDGFWLAIIYLTYQSRATISISST